MEEKEAQFKFLGKIVSVATSTAQEVSSDSIMVEFKKGDKKVTGTFASPFMDTELMKKWRRLVLSVVWDQMVKETDGSLSSFENFKNDLVGRPVWIAYIDNEYTQEVIGIGKREDYLFFPYEYGLGAVQPS